MAELRNTFSWSFSAADDFDECRRKRYWAKYAMWGGWSRDADALARTAYRLTKMENRYSLQGRAVELSVMWVLGQARGGSAVSSEEAYAEIARPFLNRAWKESRDGVWRANPKKHCCLHEHYYAEPGSAADKAWTQSVSDTTKTCIDNFIRLVLPELLEVRPESELEIATVARGGDPESFSFEGVKVYAIPDYGYRTATGVRIYDWKSGKPREKHVAQLALYGLWANTKHGLAASDIEVSIEYLASGERQRRCLAEADLAAVREKIVVSVQDMREYLVDGDIARNEPLPGPDWELTENPRACRMCNFYELCKPELDELSA